MYKRQGLFTNKRTFQKRILGLVSYLGDKQELMPSIASQEVIEVEMSDFQLPIYAQARLSELSEVKQNAKRAKARAANKIYEDTNSTYRIFSRAFCNFVFPNDKLPNGVVLKRPYPNNAGLEDSIHDTNIGNKKILLNEDGLDAPSREELETNPDGLYDDSDFANNLDTNEETYAKRIDDALKLLKEHASKYLSRDGLLKYSPKFLKILDVIDETSNDPEKDGLHLIYSQFRTIEGIGVFKLVLEENGFAELKLKKNASGVYELSLIHI